MTAVALVLAFLLGVAIGDGWHLWRHHWPDKRPAKVRILSRRSWSWKKMATLNPGATDALKVVVTNKAGRTLLPVPADAAVKVDTGDSTVSPVDPATGNFTFTAGVQEGDFKLKATTGALASADYPETVQDNAAASVTITPQ